MRSCYINVRFLVTVIALFTLAAVLWVANVSAYRSGWRDGCERGALYAVDRGHLPSRAWMDKAAEMPNSTDDDIAVSVAVEMFGYPKPDVILTNGAVHLLTNGLVLDGNSVGWLDPNVDSPISVVEY